MLESCRLCPRECGIDRTADEKGFCGETHILRAAYVGPHFGEEPPLTGRNGSGTVFLSGCSLRCSFCQNYQISHQGLGRKISPGQLSKEISFMIKTSRVHNVNFVTPDHFFPHVLLTIYMVRSAGFNLPVILNLSGYQSTTILREIATFVDIYLPDFKYSSSHLAKKLSKCPDYTDTALSAIEEMVRQKGMLKVSDGSPQLATGGVLVRHLILPGHVENSINALTSLYVEFGPKLPISLMSQYYNAIPQKEQSLNRLLTRREFEQVFQHARSLGFEQLFVQFPDDIDKNAKKKPRFQPDFTKEQPFS